MTLIITVIAGFNVRADDFAGSASGAAHT